jgi:uncharacterized membrane protein
VKLASVLLPAAALWTAALIVAPFVDSQAIYAAAGLVCHQLAERSFHFQAGPVAVCARCLGLYVGGVAGLIAGGPFGVARAGVTDTGPASARALVILAALPTAATLIAEWLLSWPVGNLARFIAALPLGGAAAFAVAAAIASEQPSRDAVLR